jgi:hypothetical protein
MTNRDPYPNLEPGWIEPLLAARPSPPAETHDRERRRWDRTHAVRISCTIVKVVCALFAVVLAANIVMVMGGANPANGVASFVRGFASAVSLGFDGRFTPANAKAHALVNDGFAAIVWLAFGAVVTAAIRRITRCGPRDLMR